MSNNRARGTRSHLAQQPKLELPPPLIVPTISQEPQQQPSEPAPSPPPSSSSDLLPPPPSVPAPIPDAQIKAETPLQTQPQSQSQHEPGHTENDAKSSAATSSTTAAAAPVIKKELPRTIYSKGLFKEAKELEAKMDTFEKAIQHALAEYREMLSLSHQKFIKSLTNIVNGLDKDLTERVVQQDNKDFAEICLKLESSCINTFQSIVKEKNDSANLVDAAVTIQRFYRGYKARKEFNKKKKQLFLRDKAAKELLSTEKTYLKGLETMMTEYMQPLIELSKKPRSFVSPEATDAIFGNVLTVYGFNAQFLPMIEARMKRWSVTTTKLSDLYFHIEHGKKAYQEYIANFDRSANVLSTCLRNYEFYRWHEEVCHKASVGSLRLNSFLIMPVQRIPRYELLLRELIAHTPEDHPDLPALRSAYENLREVSKSINEFKRAAELKVRLMEIQADLRTTCPDLAQPYRSYVDEVEVGVVLKKALRRAVLVLLSDQVLIVRCNSEKHITKMVSQVYLFNASVNITQDYDDVAVEPAPAVSSIFMDFMDSPATAEDFNFGLRIQGRAEACVVYFATAKARDEWIPKISQQKSDLHNNLSTLNLTKDEENIITESAITMAASSNANGTLSASTVVGGIGGGSGSVIVGGGSGGGGGSGSVIVGGGAGGSGSVIVVGSGGGNGNSGGVSGGISVVKDVLDLYESVVKIQDEIMQNPIDLRTLFPEYCRGMNPSIKSRLKQRIDQLNIKLNMMYQLDQRARELISAGRGAIPVQKVNQFIKEGITPIDAMKTFIVTNYKAYPAGIKDDPRITIRLILKWYLDLTDSWNKFITSDLSN